MNTIFRGMKPEQASSNLQRAKEVSNISNNEVMNQVLLKVAALRTFIFHLRSASHNFGAGFNEGASIFLGSQDT